MSGILKVQWTITPITPPQPWLACSTCGCQRPFRSSDRLRLNANGKKLDAWLIYRCSICDKTWNRTLFERRNVGDIKPGVLGALQSNDIGWINKHAFDLDGLHRHATRIDEFDDVIIEKSMVSHPGEWVRLEIAVHVAITSSIRLDRLLASELGLSRSRLQALEQDGRLTADPARKSWLRRPPSSGTRLILDLAREADHLAIGARACGPSSG